MIKNTIIIQIVLLLFFCRVAIVDAYLIKQGVHLLSDQRKAVKITRLLEKTDLPADDRRFFYLIDDIKKFASSAIGLELNKNYTTYVETDKDYLITVIFASKPDTFSAYMWRFPFFGSFPYLGYYDAQDAQDNKRHLEEKGYEVFTGKVDAFSTLGIFNDPLYSFMKKYPVYSLANLIIHELTHANIYIKNNVDFNEELATFSGREGALAYVRKTFGDTSQEFQSALVQIRENKQFYALLKAAHDALDSMYKKNIPREDKLARKKSILQTHKEEFTRTYSALFTTNHYRGYTKREWNNAFILYYMTYAEDLDIFYSLYEKNNKNLKSTMESLKQLRKIRSDPREYIRKNLL